MGMMFAQFSILIVILLGALIYENGICYNKMCAIYDGSIYDYLGPATPWILFLGYVALLAGMRSGMNDTSVYIASFESAGTTWNDFTKCFSGDIRYIFTDAVTVLFKMFISTNYHAWFLAWAVIDSLLLINVLRRESISFMDASYFFFTSLLYYNYFSMMRQWMAIVITFWGSRYIRDGKFLRYVAVCAVAAMFHTSALLMIAVYFLVRSEPWKGKQLIYIASFAAMMIFLRPILNSLERSLEGSTYDYVITTMNSSSGSSIVRAFIAAVPVVLAFLYRDEIEGAMVKICVNMSLLNLFLNILASFTNGLYVIRFATYMTVYNIILYPYLLNAVESRNKRLVKVLFYVGYMSFYIYQANYMGAWGYKSDVLTWLTNY